MDPLTHVFLPLLVAYVLRPDLFQRRRHYLIALFGLLPDFDKLLGYPGLLHSLLTLAPICGLLLLIDYLYRGDTTYGWLAVLFVLSHLPLDIIEGVPVPLLYPIVATGVGFAYPMEILFGPDQGLFWFSFEGAPITVEFDQPREGWASSNPNSPRTRFRFINEFGVASTLTFFIVYLGTKLQNSTGEQRDG